MIIINRYTCRKTLKQSFVYHKLVNNKVMHTSPKISSEDILRVMLRKYKQALLVDVYTVVELNSVNVVSI